MINSNIDELIREAMKAHETEKRDVLRLIKTEFLKYRTSKEGAGKEMDEEKEMSILKKMVAQRQDAIEQYTKANRTELAEKRAERTRHYQPVSARCAHRRGDDGLRT